VLLNSSLSVHKFIAADSIYQSFLERLPTQQTYICPFQELVTGLQFFDTAFPEKLRRFHDFTSQKSMTEREFNIINNYSLLIYE
jgi:hypothetical protein